jgi:YesN/AraC family two-component response regulator
VISVLIVDDQDLVREGLRMLLEAEPDLCVAGEAGNGSQALAQARRLDPDVVLMDVRMPGLDGIEATAMLVQGGSRARVLMLTTFNLDEYVYRAMKAGASGFLLKENLVTDDQVNGNNSKISVVTTVTRRRREQERWQCRRGRARAVPATGFCTWVWTASSTAAVPTQPGSRQQPSTANSRQQSSKGLSRTLSVQLIYTRQQYGGRAQ